jgi:hypothetical protein
MNSIAYQIMQKYPDLCLNGYLYRDRTKSTEKDTWDKFGAEHYDKAVVIIKDFLNSLKESNTLLKDPTDTSGTSYGWKHRVEEYSEKKFGKRHWIANGLFIAMLREMGIPEKPIFDSPNAKVPFGKKTLKAIGF